MEGGGRKWEKFDKVNRIYKLCGWMLWKVFSCGREGGPGNRSIFVSDAFFRPDVAGKVLIYSDFSGMSKIERILKGLKLMQLTNLYKQLLLNTLV